MKIGRKYEKIAIPIVNIDADGIGGAVVDLLAMHDWPCVPLQANVPAPSGEMLSNGKPRFANARSEWWWRAREALAGPFEDGEGWIDLDPDDDELQAQLTNIKYWLNQHGQIEVESKTAMEKRGVDSPDRGDAFVMSLVDLDPVPHILWDEMLTSDLMTRPM
jgi:hypothetical protein